MVGCSAWGCSKRSGRDKVTFHRFPKDTEIRQKWINAVNRENFNPSLNTALCSDHFEANSFVEELDKPLVRRRLYPEAIPTIFAHKNPPKRRKTMNSSKQSINIVLPEEETIPIPLSEEENIHKTCDQKYASLLKKYNSLKLLQRKNSRRVINLQHRLRKKSASVKLLKQSKRRLTKSLNNMKDVLADLKSKKFINDSQYIHLRRYYSDEKCSLIKTLLTKGSKLKQYPDDVKNFAVTLHYYSPKGYEYLRNFFQLPNASTLRKWTSNLNCNPGFCLPALNELERLCKLNADTYKYVSLVADEINLKQNLQYDKNLNGFFGYVDKGLLGDEEDMATSALVFMAIGLKGNWKLPIAYFLVNGVTSEYLSVTLKECISILYLKGIIVSSITCDGTSHNLTALELLGANLNLEDNQATISHPNDESFKISCFLDPPHMIKLIRNALESLKIVVLCGVTG